VWPLVSFVVLTYALSWAWWLPVWTTGGRVEPGRGWPTQLPGLVGPAVAAGIVTGWQRGRAGLADLGSRIVRWRVVPAGGRPWR
jgi:hypothetical protein